jgi:hypothetical protein
LTKWTWGYLYWGGVWLAAGFLIPELLGNWGIAPWPTLSETVWHSDTTYPVVATLLFALLLGLVAHFFYHRTLGASLVFALVVSVAAHLFDKHLP